MISKNWKIFIALLLLLPLASFVVAEFAQTNVFFTVPTVVSFTVTLPAGTNATSNTTTAGAPLANPATSDIWFNSSASSATHIQPCVTGGSACQTGATYPIFQYDNTGNVNISLWLSFNASLPSGVLVGVNSTCSGSANGQGVCHTALYDVNSSKNALVVSNLSFTGGPNTGNYTNVTLYANFTNYGPATNVRLLYHNSTSGIPDG